MDTIPNNAEEITKLRNIKLTIKQRDYLKLKAKDFYDMSVQKYMVHVLFPKGWEKDFENLKKKYRA